jgi:hypothetical protein
MVDHQQPSPTMEKEDNLLALLLEQEDFILQQAQAELLQPQLESLAQLRNQVEQVLHDVRSLADFRAWLRLPGRHKLFDQICQWITQDDWQRSLSSPASIPWVFADAETSQRHLHHCAYCRLQRRLAAGQQRQEQARSSQLLEGDRLLLALAREACPQALLAGRIPALPGTTLQPDIEVFDRPAPVLHIGGPDECQPQNGSMRVPAWLQGDRLLGKVELAVMADFVGQDRQEAKGELAFPNQQHRDPIVDFSVGGRVDVPLIVPRPQAPGHYLFRYCTCPHPSRGRQQLPSLPSATRGVRVRGGTRTRGAEAPVRVAVGAAGLNWALPSEPEA